MMPLVMGDSGQAYEIKRIGGNDGELIWLLWDLFPERK